MLQRGSQAASVASDRASPGDRVDRNHHLMHFGDRGENAIGEEADVGPDLREQAGENCTLENSERMIHSQDRRTVFRNATQVSAMTSVMVAPVVNLSTAPLVGVPFAATPSTRQK